MPKDKVADRKSVAVFDEDYALKRTDMKINMFNGILRRLRLLQKLGLTASKRGGYIRGLRNAFALPYGTLAKPLVRVDPLNGDFVRFDVRGCNMPLYVDCSVDAEVVKMVAVETGYNWQWHYYAGDGTPLSKDDVVLDCGAAEGLFTLYASERAASVVAVEPIPQFVRGLEKTFSSVRNVRIIQAALGDKNGSATMRVSGASSRICDDGGSGMQVNVLTLDSMCENYQIAPTYIKADLEGFERYLLAGGIKTIKKHRPKVAITAYHRHDDAAIIKKTLLACHPDYRIIEIGVEPTWGAPMMIHAF